MPNFSLKRINQCACTRDLAMTSYEGIHLYTRLYLLMIYIGAKKVRVLPLLHLLVFESDELYDEICKTFKLSAKCFFTACDYKSFNTKLPQFLNSVHARRLQASFLFTALRS